MSARPRPNALVWLLLSAVIIGLDQWSKWIVLNHMELYESRPFTIHLFDHSFTVPFWNWFRTYNTGAAFSFLSDAGGWQLWFFTALAVGISALMALWLSRTARGNWRSAVPYALVIGGALGNVIDRQMHGHVVDFIQWYIGEHKWPTFNIADMAIVVGAVGIALFGLFEGKAAKKADNANP